MEEQKMFDEQKKKPIEEKVRLTTYLAGAIESASKEEALTWREKVTKELNYPDILIYNPITQESVKVEKEAMDHVNYITGLKRGGHWEHFMDEMWKIWFGDINKNSDFMEVLNALRLKKHIGGNKKSEISYWGDFEAVIRSDFIIVNLPNSIRTIGTIYEIVAAILFRIPIYLITDVPKTETNSSLIFGVKLSQGKTFYSLTECIAYIKEKYNIK